MRLVTDVRTQKEFEDMKSIMEIFIVNGRVRQLAQNS